MIYDQNFNFYIQLSSFIFYQTNPKEQKIVDMLRLLKLRITE